MDANVQRPIVGGKSNHLAGIGEELWSHRARDDPEHREEISLPERERLSFFLFPSLSLG
jgi:hypothetical protein